MDKFEADFRSAFYNNFRFLPTADQKEAVDAILSFIINPQSPRIFILRGYAGTGKTTILEALVKSLNHIGKPSELLAPSSRAAKALARQTGTNTDTVDQHIYTYVGSEESIPKFILSKAPPKETVFIIDESSMLSAQRDEGENIICFGESPLSDLFSFVFAGEGTKIIFFGDPGRLPPLHNDISVALSQQEINNQYGYPALVSNLEQVPGQLIKSDLILNATYIRHLIENKIIENRLVIDSGTDNVEVIRSYWLINYLISAYERFGNENVRIITKTNRKSVQYNNLIRQEIFNFNSDLHYGDLVITVSNNYAWRILDKEIPYLARGEIGRIINVGEPESIEDFNFQELTLEVENNIGDVVPLNGLPLLNVLTSHTPNLSKEERDALFEIRRRKYKNLSDSSMIEVLNKDKYLNALHIKYGYSISCEIAQGAQWNNVFINMEGVLSDKKEFNDYRWLYTALTRSTEYINHINYPPSQIRNDIPQEIQTLFCDSFETFTIPEVTEVQIDNIVETISSQDIDLSIQKESNKKVDPRKNYKPLIITLLSGIFLTFITFVLVIGYLLRNYNKTELAASPSITSEIPIGFIIQTETFTPNPSNTPTRNNTPTYTQKVTQTEEIVIIELCIDIHSLRVRSGPGQEYNSIGYLLRDDCVDLVGRSADGLWAATFSGWIYTGYLMDREELDKIPIIGKDDHLAKIRSIMESYASTNLPASKKTPAPMPTASISPASTFTP